jgi:hypothetical protein
MELRQLIADNERQIFATYLAEARATRGIGFRETSRSHLGKAHLTFGNLYALFENEGDAPEQMVGGFILHDLASFPQSHPKPDLSHLPPRQVLEGGELWSRSSGAGRVARGIGAAVAGLLQAKAIILYSILQPVDLTPSYAQLGFVNASEPVRWPYAETIDGGEIIVQPLILEGPRLEEYIRSGFDFLFQTASERPTLRFNHPFARRAPRPEAEGESSNEYRYH